MNSKKKVQKKPKNPSLEQRLRKRQLQLMRISGLLESAGYLLAIQDGKTDVPKELVGLGIYLEHVGKQLEWMSDDFEVASWSVHK